MSTDYLRYSYDRTRVWLYFRTEKVFDLDPDTGLPALLEGRRWVVKKQKYSDGFDVELQRGREKVKKTAIKRNWWGKIIHHETETTYVQWDIVENWSIKLEDGMITDEAILYACISLLNFLDSKRETAAQEKHNERFLGAYPPKSING